MVHAAIFDMDGLLFDTERLCRDAWQSVAREEGYEMDDALFIACVGRNARDTREYVLGALGSDFPYERFSERAGTWMRDRMRDSGPPQKPGARRILEYFRAHDIPMALATSTSEKSARWMVERAGLSSFFGAFAFGSEVAKGKPAPDIFLLAKSRLGDMSPARCAVFEDSPAGLRAGTAAGMRTVFVPDLIAPSVELAPFIWKRVSTLEEAADQAFYEDM